MAAGSEWNRAPLPAAPALVVPDAAQPKCCSLVTNLSHKAGPRELPAPTLHSQLEPRDCPTPAGRTSTPSPPLPPQTPWLDPLAPQAGGIAAASQGTQGTQLPHPQCIPRGRFAIPCK